MKKNWLYHLGAAMLMLTLLVCLFVGHASAAVTDTDVDGDGVVRVLGIGSSFGVDGITNLYAVYQAQTGKDNLVLGNLYHGGCTLAQHVAASQSGNAFYDYYTVDNTHEDMQWSVSVGESGSYGSTLDEGLLAQNWDIIVIQQGAANAGVVDSYNEDMDTLFTYIRSKDNCKNAKLYWHMTWSFPPTYAVDRVADPLVTNYGGSTESMYASILQSMNDKVLPYVENETLVDIIPSGIAIENARTSYLKNALHRDIQHLNSLGRTITGYTYYSVIFNGGQGVDSVELDVCPADTRSDCKCAAYTMNDTDKLVVAESVANALSVNAQRKYTVADSVTDSAYPLPCTGAHGTGWTALTADNLETALAAGGKVYLSGDVSADVSDTITLASNTVLCINGHTLNFTGGLASGDKGFITVPTGIKLELCDCSGDETGAITGVGGGADSLIYLNKGTMVLHNGSISGCTGLKYAPVRVYSGGIFIMNGGTIANNQATNTGAIYLADGTACTFEMYGGQISGNTGGAYGGGVYAGANAKVQLCGGSIHTNTATNGGGVYLKGATLRLVRGNISGNKATANGGGVYATYYSTKNADTGAITKIIPSKVNLYYGTIGGDTVSSADQLDATSGNYAATSGGGIYAVGLVDGSFTEKTSVNMYQAEASIGGNCSVKFGGGVYLGTSALLVEHNGSISGNRSAQGGGVAVYNADALFTMNGGAMSENVATANGGAVRVVNGEFTMEAGELSGNRAASYGAAVTLGNDAGVFTMNGGTVSGNSIISASATAQSVIYVSNGADFVMNGGSVVDNTDNRGLLVYTTETTGLGGNAVINAGTLTGNAPDVMLMGSAPKATVYGGTVGTWDANDAARALDGCMTLYGGSFSQDPTASDKAGWTSTAGLSATRDGDYWTLFHDYTKSHTDSSHVGWVDLAAQIEGGDFALKDGVRYYLSKSVTASQSFTVTGKVLICLNGKTLTAGSGDVFPLDASGDVLYLEDCCQTMGTIDGNGKLRCFYAKNQNTDIAAIVRGGVITGFVTEKLGAAVRFNSGTFTLEGGSITGNTATDTTTSSTNAIYMNYTSRFVMTGGTLANSGAKNNIYAASSSTVSISGGCVDGKLGKSSNAAINLSGGQFSTSYNSLLADGYTIKTGNKLAYCVVRDIQFTGAVVENESSLAMRISINQLNSDELNNYTAVITKAYSYGDADQNAAAQTAGKVEGKLTDLLTDGSNGTAYLTYSNVSAKEMGDEITVTITNADGVVVDTQTYSVADQIEAILATEGISDELANLCVDALNYGAAAQTRFGYDTANLVNTGLDQSSSTQVSLWQDNLSVSQGHEAMYMATVSLKDNLELNMYFDVDCSETVPAVTVTDGTNAVAHTVSTITNGTKTILKVTVNGLAVKDAKTPVTCTVTQGDTTITVTDSLAGYVARSTSTRDEAVLTALKRYVESAIALTALQAG